MKGASGLPGLSGMKGEPGRVASKGEKGEPGLSGLPGERGLDGTPGWIIYLSVCSTLINYEKWLDIPVNLSQTQDILKLIISCQ